MSGGYLRILGPVGIFLLLTGIALATSLQTLAERNQAMLAFRDFLFSSAGPERGTGSLDAISFNSEQDSQTLLPVIDQFKRAVAQTPHLDSAQWSLGRMQMAAGDLQAAKQTLAQFQTRPIQNPLLYGDIVMTYRELGDYQAIVDFYRQIPIPVATESISETIASAYMNVGGPDAPSGVLRLRLGDMWATYQHWLQATQNGDADGIVRYASALSRFSTDAVAPSNSTRLDAALQTMPELVADGIWDLPTLTNVVAYLVWKYPDRESVEDLIKNLSTRYPDNEKWPLYLGEFYYRNGRFDAAATLYLQAQTLNPQSVEVASHLSRLAKIVCRKQGALCENLSTWVDDSIAANHADSDLEFVAATLGIDSGDVRIGPNLVENGDFAEWQGDTPEGWRFETYAGSDPDNALYIAGRDSLFSESPSARILALRGGRLSDGTMTLGEYLGPQIIADGSRYLVRITYRTDSFREGSPLILLGDYNHVGGDIILMETLASAQNVLATTRFLTPASVPGTPLLPVIRNWGSGQLWIDSVEVHPIYETRTGTP